MSIIRTREQLGHMGNNIAQTSNMYNESRTCGPIRIQQRGTILNSDSVHKINLYGCVCMYIYIYGS